MIGTTFVSAEQFAVLDRLVPPNGSFLEVGTAAGHTAARIAAQPGRTVVCVDPYPDLDHPDVVAMDGDRWTAWRLNTPPSVHLWRGDLASFRRFSKSRFDVVFIDANHTHPHVGYDLADAAKMTDLICLHDYKDATWPDVEAAAAVFCQRYGWIVAGGVRHLACLRRGVP